MKRLSIKWNIFACMIAFCFLLLVILWLFQTVFLERFYKSVKLREIGGEAQSVADSVRAGDLEGVIRIVANRGDLHVEIDSGLWGSLVITAASRRGSGVSNAASQFTAQEKRFYRVWAEGAGGVYTEQTHNADREGVLYAMLLPMELQSDILLLVSADVTPIGATVDTLRIQLFYISAVMLVLAVGIALLISRRVAGPIERLSRSARELGRGNYDVSFKAEGYREIGQLSQTLDSAARELSRTERLRQELVANVSHDLRTPLTLISGYAEMMRDMPDEYSPENMQIIIDEAKRLTSLVSGMLDLSRIRSGVQELRLEEFDVTAHTRAIIGRFAKFCEQEGYTILFEQDRSVAVFADEQRVGQVLYNFISNAVTHTGEDKLIVVRQTVRETRVFLEVIDTGEGIPPERLADIWERYYKLEAAHKRGHMGSGLGLSIVKAIMEQHPDMEYGVTSELGHGSCFWFSLPAVRERI